MRILCPYCGDRDVREFNYLGDANAARPDPDASDSMRQFIDYVYFRTNPAGPHREFWYHGSGCQSWLVVTRDTRTHEVLEVEHPSKGKGS
jgi:sarcosine oxidase subunit delta